MSVTALSLPVFAIDGRDIADAKRRIENKAYCFLAVFLYTDRDFSLRRDSGS